MSEPPFLPASAHREAVVTLAHGEGARSSREFIRRQILARLNNPILERLEDAALLPRMAGSPVMTTDSFVVSPLFFPGGDIGTLAVYGTVNDLAVAGARPLWLSAALILEEGLPFETIARILDSLAEAAKVAGVAIVAGDTKVVPRGAADQVFVITTGLGEMVAPEPAGPSAIRPGDALIVSGPIGRHGIAVLAERENLGLLPPPKSDCAPLYPAVEALRAANVPVRAMRDATRGGVAAVLHEWADESQCTLQIEEARVPVSADVRGASELLGLDPLYIACEGTMLLATPAGAAADAVAALRGVAVSAQAAPIGRAIARSAAPVVVVRGLGRELPLDDPAGLLLPRIC